MLLVGVYYMGQNWRENMQDNHQITPTEYYPVFSLWLPMGYLAILMCYLQWFPSDFFPNIFWVHWAVFFIGVVGKFAYRNLFLLPPPQNQHKQTLTQYFTHSINSLCM